MEGEGGDLDVYLMTYESTWSNPALLLADTVANHVCGYSLSSDPDAQVG